MPALVTFSLPDVVALVGAAWVTAVFGLVALVTWASWSQVRRP